MNPPDRILSIVACVLKLNKCVEKQQFIRGTWSDNDIDVVKGADYSRDQSVKLLLCCCLASTLLNLAW